MGTTDKQALSAGTGIYLYRMAIGDFTDYKRVVLLK
jgi:hypothetical protein